MQHTKRLSRETSNGKFSQKTVRIRNGLMLLPVKATSLASKCVILHSGKFVSKSNRSAKVFLGRLSRRTAILESLTASLARGDQLSGQQLYGALKSSIASYVGLFYSLDDYERRSYLGFCEEAGIKGKERPEDNMLLMPAIMSGNGVSRYSTFKNLFSEVYKKQFSTMCNYSSDGLRIDLFEQKASINEIPASVIRYISSGISEMALRVKGIERGEINPLMDLQAAEGFIGKIVEFSMRGKTCIAYYIEERVDMAKSCHRMIRK
ncbi:MAG: hypothetical protein M1448_00050 [Candidatus Marsarchaeota archaeon]|nr:hypothetical protein [Candidatus Marsarchaeota archaeon]